MFDWDRDYSDLVEQPSEAVSGCRKERAPSDRVAETSAQISSSRVMPAMFVAIFLVGLAYEKSDGVRSVLSFRMVANAEGSLPLPSAPSSVPEADALMEPLPPELRVYEQAQYARFMAGLRAMTEVELATYARKTRADLDAAPVALAPFYRDALFLLEREAGRRGM